MGIMHYKLDEDDNDVKVDFDRLLLSLTNKMPKNQETPFSLPIGQSIR